MNNTTMRSPHNIDLNAPGGIAALFAYNRAIFGDAVMQDPASVQDDGTPPSTDAATPPAAAPVTPPETVTPATTPETPVTPPAPVVEPAVPPVVTPPAPAAVDNDDSDDEDAETPEEKEGRKDLPEWADKALTRAKNQAADRRLELKAAKDDAAKTLADLSEVLGLSEVASSVSVATAAISSLKTSLNDLRIETALTAAIAEAGADAKMTRAVALGDKRLEGLDPSAADFAEKVKLAVAATVEAYPLLLSGVQSPGSSGLDVPNRPLDTVTKAQFKAMRPSEKSELSKTNPSLYRSLSGDA